MTDQKKSKISELPGNTDLNKDTGNLHEPITSVVDLGELPPVNASKDSNDNK
jgi:hypothetical protein